MLPKLRCRVPAAPGLWIFLTCCFWLAVALVRAVVALHTFADGIARPP
jgi:hypothetical protein